LEIAFGIFVVLHGLVHLLYAGHSARRFQLKPGMAWPDESWALSRAVREGSARARATVALVLATLGFVVGGVGIIAGQDWGRPLTVGAAAFSALLYLLFWNAKPRNLDGQGAVGVLIDVAILVAGLVFQFPQIGV
jgi:hypothetical protein